MDTIKQAISALWTLILSLVGMVVSVIALVEDWLHLELNRLGVDRTTQSIIMIVTSVVLVLLAFPGAGRPAARADRAAADPVRDSCRDPIDTDLIRPAEPRGVA